jgi:hypothetical protein
MNNHIRCDRLELPINQAIVCYQGTRFVHRQFLMAAHAHPRNKNAALKKRAACCSEHSLLGMRSPVKGKYTSSCWYTNKPTSQSCAHPHEDSHSLLISRGALPHLRVSHLNSLQITRWRWRSVGREKIGQTGVRTRDSLNTVRVRCRYAIWPSTPALSGRIYTRPLLAVDPSILPQATNFRDLKG